MRIIFLITILFATAPPASFSTAAQRCLTYEPTAVVVYGKLRRHRFAGPPNYESVAKGDVPENVAVCILSNGSVFQRARIGIKKATFPTYKFCLWKVKSNTIVIDHCSVEE